MKKPFVTLEQAKKIIEQYPTPFHIYDEKGIRENARKVNQAFSWNKGFREYFAVKATPTPGILQVLKEEGCGADCSSLTELMMADAIGCKGHDIMFSSNVTPAEDFIKAAEMGAIINFDDFTHISYFEKLAAIPETVCCRFNPGGVFQVSNDIMDHPGDAKYGMTKTQLTEAFKILKEKGAKHFGIHSFLASSTKSNDYYPMLAKILFELAVELKNELDIHIAFINLSGGVGIPYEPHEVPCDIMVIGEGVRKVYEEVLVPEGMDDVAIFTEMGRFMLAPYGALITEAIHEKHIYKEYIGVDACAVNLMRPAMYGSYHHIVVANKMNEDNVEEIDIAGNLCESGDLFARDRPIPKLEEGDLLAILNAGAYAFSMASQYNSRPRPAEVLVNKDEVDVIRRREEFSDLFNGQKIPTRLLK